MKRKHDTVESAKAAAKTVALRLAHENKKQAKRIEETEVTNMKNDDEHERMNIEIESFANECDTKGFIHCSNNYDKDRNNNINNDDMINSNNNNGIQMTLSGDEQRILIVDDYGREINETGNLVAQKSIFHSQNVDDIDENNDNIFP